jgi:hypothetical protein
MQPRPDTMVGLACCALRSVSRPRATLRAVWWFSRQAAENRRHSKEPKLEAQNILALEKGCLGRKRARGVQQI